MRLPVPSSRCHGVTPALASGPRWLSRRFLTADAHAAMVKRRMGLAELTRGELWWCIVPRPRGGAFSFMVRTFAAIVLFLGIVTQLEAAGVNVVVADQEGQPLQDVVVLATPLGPARAAAEAKLENGGRPTVTISQQNKEFVPYVTAVRMGTAISFPNQDNILHNVYSFSKAKRFELPLYKDKAPEPVVFDKPGVVVLGCNIHDWMVAYVYVLETPYFAKTGPTGKAQLVGLPVGEYEVRARHPRKSKRGSSPPQHVHVKNDLQHIELVLALKPEWRPQRNGKQ